MTLNSKIKHFYDTVKIRGAVPVKNFRLPLSIAIPAAAALSIAVSAAFIIPTVLKRTAQKGIKKPTGAL